MYVMYLYLNMYILSVYLYILQKNEKNSIKIGSVSGFLAHNRANDREKSTNKQAEKEENARKD